jgi:RNA polymerase sigma-70 factor, ECF subfamily
MAEGVAAEGSRDEPAAAREHTPIQPESSILLMRRAQAGDVEALNRLCARYLPRLRRWASGRLPRWARDLRETDDLVQDTIAAVIPRIVGFEFRHDGAFQAYLRQALLNRVREEIRRVRRAPARTDAQIEVAADLPSPLEDVVGRELVETYEASLQRLRIEDQQVIVARVEMRSNYSDIAREMDLPSPDAARMAVSRALVRLAKEMGRGHRA